MTTCILHYWRISFLLNPVYGIICRFLLGVLILLHFSLPTMSCFPGFRDMLVSERPSPFSPYSVASHFAQVEPKQIRLPMFTSMFDFQAHRRSGGFDTIRLIDWLQRVWLEHALAGN
jgi:hypothetical protein